MSKLTRREFLRLSALGLGTVVVANSLTGCVTPSLTPKVTSVINGKATVQESNAVFTHGVASGDPLSDRVILWTRATPLLPDIDDEVVVSFQVALDEGFTSLVTQGAASSNKDRDFTFKIDVTGLNPDTTYYYRFLTRDNTSLIGRTRTLPVGRVEHAKFLVMSCAYYSAGYYHVYKEAAKIQDANAVIHLGDYIYEYGPGIYADEDAEAMNRVMQPAHEIFKLSDYRQRYAQTRTDENLQALHANSPFIAIWDDHEVANDTWATGAENHSQNEGDFSERRLAALQAYVEWMPIRPPVDENIYSIQRNFQFGDLVNLSLIDARLIAREEQIAFANYIDPKTGAFDGQTFYADLNAPERELVGRTQLATLQESFNTPAVWQLLGQQVLMGEMKLPAPIVMQQISGADYGALAQKAQTGVSLSAEEQAILAAPSVPYNMDAWDGYPAERARLLQMAKDNNINLVVLAGDTHNAWASDLKLKGDLVGVEFATSSVTSPGLEKYVNSTAEDEAGTVALIEGLKYCNMVERGFMSVVFTREQATANWTFVDTVKKQSYRVMNERSHQEVVTL